MNIHVREFPIEALVDGAHEKCAWCKTPLFVDGVWRRWKALDGKYYCKEEHASAPYLTPRSPRDRTGW